MSECKHLQVMMFCILLVLIISFVLC